MVNHCFCIFLCVYYVLYIYIYIYYTKWVFLKIGYPKFNGLQQHFPIFSLFTLPLYGCPPFFDTPSFILLVMYTRISNSSHHLQILLLYGGVHKWPIPKMYGYLISWKIPFPITATTRLILGLPPDLLSRGLSASPWLPPGRKSRSSHRRHGC